MKTSTDAVAGGLLPARSLVLGAAQAADQGAHVPLGRRRTLTGHPRSQGGQKFAELVAQKSGGKITVKLFPGGVLGGDVQVLSAVQGGTIDMTSMNCRHPARVRSRSSRSSTSRSCSTTRKEADAVVDGPIGKKLADKLPEKGLVSLALLRPRVSAT